MNFLSLIFMTCHSDGIWICKTKKKITTTTTLSQEISISKVHTEQQQPPNCLRVNPGVAASCVIRRAGETDT